MTSQYQVEVTWSPDVTPEQTVLVNEWVATVMRNINDAETGPGLPLGVDAATIRKVNG